MGFKTRRKKGDKKTIKQKEESSFEEWKKNHSRVFFRPEEKKLKKML